MSKEQKIIWVLGAVIVVLIIALVWQGRGSSPTPAETPGAETENQNTQTPPAETSQPSSGTKPTTGTKPATSSARRTTVTILPKATDNISGTATITELSPTSVRVVIRLSGYKAGQSYPAAIRSWQCSKYQGIVKQLNTANNGYSSTDVPLSLNKLMFDVIPYSVTVNASLDSLATVSACGDITKSFN